MNNQELFSLMKAHPGTRSALIGVYAIDTLPSEPVEKRPAAYIVNTAKSTNSGDHWIAVLFPPNSLPEYFDSYGMKPKDTFVNFMRANFYYNNVSLQSALTTTCGQFCLYYIFMRTVFLCSMTEIIEFLNSKGTSVDEYVNRFVEKIYQTDLDVQDQIFLRKQILKYSSDLDDQ